MTGAGGREGEREREAASVFWPAAWLAAALSGPKVVLLGAPGAAGRSALQYAQDVAAVTHADLLFAAGLAVNGWIIGRWAASGFGPLAALRPALVGLVLMAAGAQVGFASFLLSLMRLERKK